MVKEGYYFGLPLLVLGPAAYLAQWTSDAVILPCLALFVFSFFRDPERVISGERDYYHRRETGRCSRNG